MSDQQQFYTLDFKLTVIGEVETGMPIGELCRRYDLPVPLLILWTIQYSRFSDQVLTAMSQAQALEPPDPRGIALTRAVRRIARENPGVRNVARRISAERAAFMRTRIACLHRPAERGCTPM